MIFICFLFCAKTKKDVGHGKSPANRQKRFYIIFAVGDQKGMALVVREQK